ncbi:hypothetical protein CC86DRAFT_411093 [Ophiobolus disseminans]|uniref:Uncharacterized protein n=1 Tax=Ophiobolus disseminans TaxID=1469910 RepID=A0A6A6ZL65_9PLEO|nr:hypothetical protein CC86DRAFT_411093 [Ophiobolus disseminans]
MSSITAGSKTTKDYTIRYPGQKFGCSENGDVIKKAREWEEHTAGCGDRVIYPCDAPSEKQILDDGGRCSPSGGGYCTLGLCDTYKLHSKHIKEDGRMTNPEAIQYPSNQLGYTNSQETRDIVLAWECATTKAAPKDRWVVTRLDEPYEEVIHHDGGQIWIGSREWMTYDRVLLLYRMRYPLRTFANDIKVYVAFRAKEDLQSQEVNQKIYEREKGDVSAAMAYYTDLGMSKEVAERMARDYRTSGEPNYRKMYYN